MFISLLKIKNCHNEIFQGHIIKFYILSGGPGSGKSSIISELVKLGHQSISETGRDIIKEQVKAGSDALPWKNKVKFRDLMVTRDIEQYYAALKLSGPVFFDRGIPDSIGYSNLENLPESTQLNEAVRKYHYQPKVFFTQPWIDIYHKDTERKQNFAESVASFEAIRKAYVELGYEIIEVPFGSVSERAQFILAAI